MFGRNAKLGFKEKIRTVAEIDAEYGHHAGQAGHKAALAKDLMEESEGHIARMTELRKQAAAAKKAEDLLKTSAAIEPIPPQQGST